MRNYAPISLLAVFNKILEKVMHNIYVLIKHCSWNN